ncbi:hypothetical protein JCM1840_005112 [Sporobolomyces johnsonii]
MLCFFLLLVHSLLHRDVFILAHLRPSTPQWLNLLSTLPFVPPTRTSSVQFFLFIACITRPEIGLDEGGVVGGRRVDSRSFCKGGEGLAVTLVDLFNISWLVPEDQGGFEGVVELYAASAAPPQDFSFFYTALAQKSGELREMKGWLAVMEERNKQLERENERLRGGQENARAAQALSTLTHFTLPHPPTLANPTVLDHKPAKRQYPVYTPSNRTALVDSLTGYERPLLSNTEISVIGDSYYKRVLPLVASVTRRETGKVIDGSVWPAAQEERRGYLGKVFDLNKGWTEQEAEAVELAIKLSERDIPELAYCPPLDNQGAKGQGAWKARQFIRTGFDEARRSKRSRGKGTEVKLEHADEAVLKMEEEGLGGAEQESDHAAQEDDLAGHGAPEATLASTSTKGKGKAAQDPIISASSPFPTPSPTASPQLLKLPSPALPITLTSNMGFKRPAHGSAYDNSTKQAKVAAMVQDKKRKADKKAERDKKAEAKKRRTTAQAAATGGKGTGEQILYSCQQSYA